MRIVDIRETAIPLKSDLKNSSIDFSEMTTSVVAVITDMMATAHYPRRVYTAAPVYAEPVYVVEPPPPPVGVGVGVGIRGRF